MPVTWNQVRDILDDVLQIPPEDRSRYLDNVCPQPELRRYVDSLILSYAKADEFLEQPAIDQHAETWGDAESLPLWVGRRIGPYLIEEEIGEGGMGTVFQAVRADEEYQKRVAIKLVKGGFASSSAIARFKGERQILAGLEHPHIARLLDGGRTEEGYPYLVMEFIEGMPIDEYCDTHRLGISQRLQLFRAVCGAVQFAHQNLVIHRDLKPGNILVTREGVPKLLDFGIAKLLSPDSLSPTPEPTVGLLRMLTPAYASPEQVRGEPVNTATDVYSLGVVLYMLLTGHRPYQLTDRSPQAVADTICHTEPVKPSEIVVRTEMIGTPGADGMLTVTPESVSSPRDSKPDKLRRRLSGDLDNIVLMALRKDPQRRYSSVEQFSDDVRRHLKGLPVRAREDTLTYRSSRFVKRHKLAVAAVTVFAITLLGGIVTTMREARIARAERVKAERRFNDVRELANSLVFDVHDSIQNLPGSTPARKLIVDRALRYLDQLSRDATEDVSLQRELAAAYRKLGQVQGGTQGSNLGDTRGALESYGKALKLSEAVVARNPHNLEDLKNLARSYSLMGSAENHRRAMQIRESLVRADPSDLGFLKDLALSYRETGSDLSGRNDLTGALEKYRESLRLLQQLVDADPKNGDYRRELSYAHKRVGAVLTVQKKLQEGLEHYRTALRLDETLVAENPDDAQLRYDITYTYSDIGYILGSSGDRTAALASYRKALSIRKALAAADPKDVKVRGGLARTYNYIGLTLQGLGRLEEALSTLLAGAAIREGLVSADPANKGWPVELAYSYEYVGFCYAALASASHEAASKRLTLWRQAQQFLQRALPVLQEQEKNHALAGDGVGAPERVSYEIAKCDAAIAQLQAATGAVAGSRN
jgi:eukaryotic-like serine/threonine-protein kinase